MAGCKSDCLVEFESEVEPCQEMYDDQGDTESLKVCIDEAKSEYQSCIDECENWVRESVASLKFHP